MFIVDIVYIISKLSIGKFYMNTKTTHKQFIMNIKWVTSQKNKIRNIAKTIKFDTHSITTTTEV